MPSALNNAEPLNELYLEELVAYCALLPLNWILSPEFTVIDGAVSPVFDVIDAHLPPFTLYSIVLVNELSYAVQLIVPPEEILNVKGSFE